MNDKINQPMLQLAALVDELRAAVHRQKSRVFFQLKGKRIELDKSARDAHCLRH